MVSAAMVPMVMLYVLMLLSLFLQGEMGGPGQKGSKGDKGEAVSLRQVAGRLQGIIQHCYPLNCVAMIAYRFFISWTKEIF